MASLNMTDVKNNIEHVDASHQEDGISNPKLEEGLERHVDPVLDRQTLLRLDLLLVPLVCSMYLMAFLDRANIGNARIAGLQTDLGITDIQYQTGEFICPSHKREGDS